MSGYVYESAVQRQPWRVIRELARARHLLLDLVWKDLRARYRYTVLGFFWAVAQPVALMVLLTFIFTVVFPGRLDAVAGAPQRDFAVMILCGLVFWQFLATALSAATRSVVDNRTLVNKVHFAREVLPLAAVLYPLVNLALGVVVLVVVHLARGGEAGLGLLWLAPLFVIELALATGLGLLCACGQVYYQDVGYLVDIGLLFGFYASPVFYPLEWILNSGAVPELVRALYLANPMAGLLSAYREILFAQQVPAPSIWLWPALCSLLLLLAGLWLFRRCAPTFSDRL
ncbi:MAG: ABC transporter permease [Candidatus Hydrogenedentes bacterium]|nr:ABC transporter permease [Candidatus Hydrogenedentota bacterium]